MKLDGRCTCAGHFFVVRAALSSPFDCLPRMRYYLCTMRNAYLVVLVTCCLGLPGLCLSADAPVAEWSFSGASDTLGWRSAGGNIGLDKDEGALTISGTECRLISPLFDIKATPWQFVEIEMKAEKTGDAILFYSNTTEEPYGGFRGGLQTSFHVIGDGEYHKYIVLPGWQAQGKIIHIRIDPPGNTGAAVRSVRIGGWEPGAADTTRWSFERGNAGWRAIALSGEPVETKGWLVTGDRQAAVFSPAIDAPADSMPWLTLRLASKSPNVVLFRWLCDGRAGVQSVPIEVKGGGKLHSYVVDMSKISQWSGRILGVGITPTDSTDAREVALESVSLAATPVGPPEIKITSFGTDQPINRAGDKTKLVMEATNVGGTEARRVTATVTVMAGETPEVLPVRIANTLAPGKSVRFEWDKVFTSAGSVMAASSASAAGIDADQKQAHITIYPKLDEDVVQTLKYVPEPVPADTGDQLVGCYYYPGWIDYGRWSVLNGFPERRPILGYHHDGNPEVADWHINWALSHGIKFLIYDWYWNRGSRHLEEALHDGFLKSKYQDKMKFCLLWANHNGPGSHSEADMISVTKYWIENYFKRPNYLKLNGKNVVVIFTPKGITDDMGVEGAKAAFDKMRKLCEEAGVGGLYLVACSWPSAQQIRQIEEEGYDAISGYNYPSAGDRGQNVAPYAWMVEAYKEIWNQIDGMSRLPYIPLCEAGWDSRPWHGPSARVRTGKSAGLWQQMLTNARDYNNSPGRKLPEGQKLVFIEAWNEFGEGDYIEPTAGDGFSYLEAMRQVFAPKSKQPTVIVPRDLGMGPYDIPAPVLRTSWDFSKPEERVWAAGGLTTPDYEGGVLRTEAVSTDPTLSASWVEIDSSKYKTFEVRMRIDKPGEGQVFFRSRDQQLSEDKSVKFALKPGGEFHTYEVDMTANPAWKGTIGALRFDPTSTIGAKIEISHIKFR